MEVANCDFQFKLDIAICDIKIFKIINCDLEHRTKSKHKLEVTICDFKLRLHFLFPKISNSYVIINKSMYDLLCDAYSYDARNKKIWDSNWKETDDFFYNNPEIVL